MIGNSPRSDINPALSAGLNAIFVPHPSTWVLEREVVVEAPSGQTLLEITTFSQLLRKRSPLYRSAADFEIDTSRMTHDEVAETILSKLEELSAVRQ